MRVLRLPKRWLECHVNWSKISGLLKWVPHWLIREKAFVSVWNYFHKENGAATVPTHQTLQAFQGKRPLLGPGAFVAPNACVIGDVKLGSNSSVWYGAVLRGMILQNDPLCKLQQVLRSANSAQQLRCFIAGYEVLYCRDAYR